MGFEWFLIGYIAAKNNDSSSYHQPINTCGTPDSNVTSCLPTEYQPMLNSVEGIIAIAMIGFLGFFLYRLNKTGTVELKWLIPTVAGMMALSLINMVG